MQNSTNMRIVQTEGSRQVSRQVKHYNLQMIIAVGFKVNNDRAVQFRKWANTIVKDYTIQGWAMDSDRLKNGGTVLSLKCSLRLLLPCVVVCIPLKIILQERRPLVCTLSFLFVRTQRGRMVDSDV